MMANNDGKEYEDLTAKCYRILSANEKYTSVEQNVKLDGPDGPRQIDVLLRSRVADMDLMTIVECKDYNKIVTLPIVDNLDSLRRDVNANQAVLVARKGFSSRARRKASRVGITLVTVRDVDRGFDNIGLRIHALVTSIQGVSVIANLPLDRPASGTERIHLPSMNIIINDEPEVPMFERIESDLRAGAFDTTAILPIETMRTDGSYQSNLRDFQDWNLNLDPAKDHYICSRDESGIKIKLSSTNPPSFKIGLYGCFHVGYLTDLPNTSALVNLTSGKRFLFLDGQDFDLKRLNGAFETYDNISRIPPLERVHLNILKKGAFDRGVVGVDFK